MTAGSFRGINRRLTIAGACMALVVEPLAAQAPAPVPAPGQLREAMLTWRIGLDWPRGPSRAIEVITRATWKGRDVWRVVHHQEDPTTAVEGRYDMHDVDALTMTPVRNVMRTDAFALEIDFTPEAVTYRRRAANGDSAIEHVPLTASVMAEGPALTALVASLPLAADYTTSFAMLDRWQGRERERIRPVTLRVTGRGSVQLDGRSIETLLVVIRADDGAFRFDQQVTAEAPHLPLTIEFTRGTSRVRSAVTSIAVGRGAPPK
jgi:hypothetical protein